MYNNNTSHGMKTQGSQHMEGVGVARVSYPLSPFGLFSSYKIIYDKAMKVYRYNAI